MALQALGEPSRRIYLDHQRRRVGRSSTCDLQLTSDAVSSSHAAVWHDGATSWICDLGSTNGTRLNGRRVGGAPEPVRPGDRVEIGGVVLMLTRSVPDRGLSPATGLLSGAPPAAHFAIESQRAGLINNVDGVQHFGHRVTHHNNVDINPLPRSPTGRRMIYTGILLKVAGVMLVLYWLSLAWSGFAERRQQSWDPARGILDFPSPVPWVPAGMLLVLIGGSLTVAGIVAAFSSRRKVNGHQHQ
jgi:hypothetical protein